MLRYGLYTRKSDKEDGDTIKSIEDQKAYWNERAQQQGLLTAKIYEENKSAMIPGTRPIYKQMLADLKAGRIDAVLVWHVNRLTRNVAEAGEFAQLLIDGVIKEVRSPNAVYTPADNILPLLLEQGMAVQFSRDLSRTMKLTMEQKAKDGGWSHRARLGYLNARDPLNARRGIVVTDPERFPLVRRGMEMMLTGNYTIHQAIDAMNSWGLRTKPTDHSPAQPVAYNRGYYIFRSPFYAGYVYYKGSLYKGRHTPMLSTAEFHRLQCILDKHPRVGWRCHQFAYTGMMRCGWCGFQITAESRSKNGRQYIYYHCCDPYGKCSKRGIPEPVLEKEIAAILQSLQIDPQAADVAREELRRNRLGMIQTLAATHEQQRARLAAIEREQDALLTSLIQGIITDQEVYKRKEKGLLTERNQLMEALEQAEDQGEQVAEQARRVLDFACRAHDEFCIAEPDRKRTIASALGIEYSLRGRELTVRVNPFLEKIVTLVQQNVRIIEPGNGGSGSQNSSFFCHPIPFGSPNSRSIALDSELSRLLIDGTFPDVFSA